MRYLPLRTELPISRIDIIIDYKFTLSVEESNSELYYGNKEKTLSYLSNRKSKAIVSPQYLKLLDEAEVIIRT